MIDFSTIDKLKSVSATKGKAPLKILICGGGCAGPALAYWLSLIGHQVIVVERFPAPRATGAQVDLRGEAIKVVTQMGLMDAIRRNLVDEPGVAFVNSEGKTTGRILANKSGRGAQSLTSEYEIMRGDLVRILYEATRSRVKYIFGKTVERFEQDDRRVVVYFSDGSSDTFDLLVGADGQGSRIRKVLLSASDSDTYLRMGIHIAYWLIPRIATDTNIRNSYISPGGKLIMRRSHNLTDTQVYFFLRDDSKEASAIHKAAVEKQKDFWSQRFQGEGWQTDRFLEGMKTAENFYSQEALQVRTPTWSKGRVVLLGDAAYCASPFSGMGITAGLIGAYVLAGEINRLPHNLSRAFANYDRVLRPFINAIQDINPFLLRLGMPKTRWGSTVLDLVGRVVMFLRIPDLMARFAKPDKGGWKLPEYPELISARRSVPSENMQLGSEGHLPFHH